MEYKGSIEDIEPEDKGTGLYRVALRLTSSSVPKNMKRYRNGFYDVRLNDFGSILERRLRAIQRMDDESSMNQDIWEAIMGVPSKLNRESFYIPSDETDNLNVPSLRPLNDSQRAAIAHALRSRFSIIQGPPGTGKTSSCEGRM